ncbi:GNAT family N-acetyltransferase [Candidatus Micrarchaeota archaeon]|nr:GNAT family N-acetyltransferase [Candidatus Micrarchaeota archaeon]
MHDVVWRGSLKSGMPVEIRKTVSGRDFFSFSAHDAVGNKLADRTASHEGNGRYVLNSNVTGYDLASDHHFTVVHAPNEGIGSRLVALALNEAQKRNATEVRLGGIENSKWATHLIQKLGAVEINGFSKSLRTLLWGKSQLDSTAHPPWHSFLV